MFNGWMELSVDQDVINRGRVYTLATPTHDRVSLGIGAGPSGKVYVRNADGTVMASTTIGPAPAFIEPWTFVKGQTVQTERLGTGLGNVTVTMFDVPPDVTRATTIGAAAVQVAVEQPGQNAAVTFDGREGQQLLVHVSGNSIKGVAVHLLKKDGAAPLASAVSAASSFGLPPVALPATGTYTVVVDPTGPNTGVLNVAIAEK
jgi:hypothetical protein